MILMGMGCGCKGAWQAPKKARRAHDEAGEVNFAVIPFANMLRSNAGERVRVGGMWGVYVACVCVCVAGVWRLVYPCVWGSQLTNAPHKF